MLPHFLPFLLLFLKMVADLKLSDASLYISALYTLV